MTLSRYLIFILLWCQMVFVSLAQMNTDRPSQSLGTGVVNAGQFQFENGLQLDAFNGYIVTTYSTPLVRYGVNESFELRFFTNFTEDISIIHTPFSFGFKNKLSEEKGLLPELSFAGHIGLTTGNNGLKSLSVVPNFRFIANHSLGENWSLGYNWGIDWNDNDDTIIHAFTLIVGTNFSEKIGWFGELYGFIADPDNEFGVDTGLTYLLKDRLQLDVSGGAGLTRGLPDWFFNFGISYALGK